MAQLDYLTLQRILPRSHNSRVRLFKLQVFNCVIMHQGLLRFALANIKSIIVPHFKASEHSPKFGSAWKLEDHLTTTTIDKIHAQSAEEGHRLMPSVFTLEKGQPHTKLRFIECGHLFHYVHILISYNVDI